MIVAFIDECRQAGHEVESVCRFLWGVPRILDKFSLDERMGLWPEVEGSSHRREPAQLFWTPRSVGRCNG